MPLNNCIDYGFKNPFNLDSIREQGTIMGLSVMEKCAIACVIVYVPLTWPKGVGNENDPAELSPLKEAFSTFKIDS